MLGRLVNEHLKKKSPEYPLGNTLNFLRDADVRICNLECVISDRGEPWTNKAFHFKTDIKNIEVLKTAGFDPVSIANNHVLDYGYEAFLEMLKTLAENGTNFAGAGINADEAREPAICRIKNKNIGLIAFSDGEPGWEATKFPGIFYVPINSEDKRSKTLFNATKKAKEIVDFLVISAHWGPNWGYRPPPEHISFAHRLIDSGADIIFGHSGHVFRGIEIYKNKPILYCAGNFIDDYAVDEIERNDESFIFNIEIDKTVKRGFLQPTIINNFQATIPDKNKSKEIADKMQKLCREFNTKTNWNFKKGVLEIEI